MLITKCGCCHAAVVGVAASSVLRAAEVAVVQEPCSSWLPLKPGPPPATTPPLAPHSEALGQKENSAAAGRRLNRSRSGAESVAGGSGAPPCGAAHSTFTRVLLADIGSEVRRTCRGKNAFQNASKMKVLMR